MSRAARASVVAMLSGGSMALEILLVRWFGIEQFHHFAYLALNVAMLGFAAGGTAVAVIPLPDPRALDRWLRWSAVAAGTALVITPMAARALSPDLTQLLWDQAQLWRFGLMIALLALPFTATAVTTLLAIQAEPERTGTTYGASFVGAAVGSSLALVILWVAPPGGALAFPGVLGGISCLVIRPSLMGRLAGAAITAVAATALVRPAPLRVNAYKGLPQVEAYPGARRVAERYHPVGWVVAVDAPAFRDAPGLSLAYTGTFPRQTALFLDGGGAGSVTHWDPGGPHPLLDWLPGAVPYLITVPSRVLVLGAGAGLEISAALAHGASHVTVAELHPDLAGLARSLASGDAGVWSDPRVRTVIGDVRSMLARNREPFDVISLGPGGALGTGAAGVYALNEDFLHTVEAYQLLLARLTDHGVLGITRWLRTPPRDDLRTVLTAAAALERMQPGMAASGLIVLRSWGTVTVLARPAGFARGEVERIKAWAESRRFDVDWHPGYDSTATQVINTLPEPVFTRAAGQAVSSDGRRDEFARGYAFDVAPVSDANPYPHHTLSPRMLLSLLTAERGAWLPFAEWGYLALVASLAIALVLGAPLILLPMVMGGPGRESGRQPHLLVYFSAIGLGYLVAELAVIQQLQLLLGHPVYAVAVTLSGLLLFSGLGSAWSDQLGPGAPRVLPALAALLVIAALTSLDALRALMPSTLPVRAGAALAVIAPLGWLMGCPFALGLRRLAGRPRRLLAWAWAANGLASVVAAPLGALVAIGAGSRVVLLMAAGCYGLAAVAFRWMEPWEPSASSTTP
ncbi:MAG TPA: hypothetical protein VD793_04180 [Gemmatimonadales bacterium]|nr:hypothetical protein [Gemmatimonadales bacterium]